MTENRTLWSPSVERIEQTNLKRYCDFLYKTLGVQLNPASTDLYQWSITEREKFWLSLWDFLEIVASEKPTAACVGRDFVPRARWFPGARLNYAENLLRFRDKSEAIVFWGEGAIRVALTYEDLYRQVTSLASHLRRFGVKPGDRIAAIVANTPAAAVGMLAATAIGAIWSSCSPDFGVSGIVDRFEQIEAKILIACDGYYFKGKRIGCLEKLAQTLPQLPTVKHLIISAYAGDTAALPAFSSSHDFDDLLRDPPANFSFEQLPAEHPLVIMFSSGTTGKPKCIVHGAAGTIIEHRKELELHSDLKRGETIFYQTTCGWMMWNWLVSSLATGARMVLFDGSPLHEEGRILFRLASEERVNIFGTNAKFLSLIEKDGIKPGSEFSLSSLRCVLSTGSVLAPESFDYVYREIKKDIQLASISGGTDILGCFALGDPALPVYRGTLQTRSFGLAVEVFDESGKSTIGRQGELVCTKPFPSMPIYFWNDADGSRFQKAYFEKFPGVWTHGDFTELLPSGAMVFYGRSDATLNPGGVRIGTSEIYRQVEKVPEVLECVAVAHREGSDEQIALFVVLQKGAALDSVIEEKIRSAIRKNLTAFHVPRFLFAVSDLPKTRSGKVVELALRDILEGKTVNNTEALANPEALEQFQHIAARLPKKGSP